MSLDMGTHPGPYEIRTEPGAGGMDEVNLAHRRGYRQQDDNSWQMIKSHDSRSMI